MNANLHRPARRLLFYGNCQVQYIGRVFAELIAPLTGDTSRYFDINHTRFENPDHARAFRDADILIDQVFDVPDPIPEGLVAPSVKRLRIPNMRGDFLWPYGTRERHPRHENLPDAVKYFYAQEYGDSFLNRMIMKDVAPREAVDAYLQVDFTRQRNLPRILEISMDRQERRDRIAGIEVARHMQDNLRREVMFYSPGHPSERLLHLVARPVLHELVGGELAERALAGQFLGFPHWRAVPVHPGAARVLGLEFVRDTSRYSVYDEGHFTFEEYALRYMRGEHVFELADAVRRFSKLDGNALWSLASSGLRKAPMSALAHRLCGQALRQLRQPVQAQEFAFRALALEPENPQNWQEAVSVFVLNDDLEAAERWARLAVSKFPRHAPIYHALCDALLGLNQMEAAGQYARVAADLHPGHVVGQLRSVRILIAADQTGQAAELLERVRKLDPNSADAAQLSAAILDRRGERPAAIQELRAAVQRRPDDPHTHAKLAQMLSQNGDHKGAEDAYRAAIALQPEIAGFHGGLADSVDRQGRRQDAISLLRQAVAAGHADMHLQGRLAHLLGREGEFSAAEAAYREAILRGPGICGFHAGLAEVLEWQGRRKDAIDAARQATACTGASAWVWGYLGYLTNLERDHVAAEAALRTAIAMAPADSRFHVGLADALEGQGRRADAIAMLRNVVRGAQSDARLLARLGAMLSREGDFGAAEDVLRRAIQVEPKVASHHVLLAETCERQRRFADAVAVIRAALGSLEPDARMYAHLGYFLLCSGDAESSEDAYRVAVAMDPSVPGYKEGLTRASARAKQQAASG